MIAREDIRPNRYYWVVPRKANDTTKRTLASMSGELPSLSMRTLDKPNSTFETSLPSDYDFIGEADLDKLFEATFHGAPPPAAYEDVL